MRTRLVFLLVLQGAACGEDVRIAVTSGLPVAPACNGPLDGQTVARFAFEDPAGSTQIADLVGPHVASLVGGGLTPIAGPAGCGQALLFPPRAASQIYMRIENSPALAPPTGAIEFWLRVPATHPAARVGIISRDAMSDPEAGHLTLYWLENGQLALRLQHGTDAVRCSNGPLPGDTWLSVLVNFGAGPLQLVINGAAQDGRNLGAFIPGDGTCGTNTTLGIDGNDNPWAVGASSDGSSEGQLDIVAHYARGVAIDELRFSSVRRPVSASSP